MENIIQEIYSGTYEDKALEVLWDELQNDYLEAEDKGYYLNYLRRSLYSLVSRARYNSNPQARLLNYLQAESIAKFLSKNDR